ncbi:FAD-dependent oxidoreductase [Oscillospiraceae bacterium MB08-C2-2]|nr:FAD-dependent oxidoreductase [Oscillospiraceae bacterium MB08-C2-2]
MSYVIIGNSAAAVGCVEGIRQVDAHSPILLIADEPHHTYSRPLISYLLQGKTDEDRMRYRSKSFYSDNGCETLFGETVTSIQPEEKTVLLEGGRSIPYEKLLVATGSSPFVPPVPGLETVENQSTFMTLEDARALQEKVTAETRVLILGAGLIGLKCAEGLWSKTKSITVVDMADHILPSILDVDAAQIISDHIAAQGIELLLSQSVKEFQGNKALLTGGGEISFDRLVIAVGVRPNTALVANAGGKVNRGIATDTLCQTSLPDIYAAGDCTESYDITKGECRVLALLPNAYTQGECAGINMAGGESRYDKALPMNAIGFFGKHIITAGTCQGEEYASRDGEGYKRLFYEDNVLKGYILVEKVARAGIYTALIREQTPLDTLDFDLIKEHPQLMAFSKEQRQKKMGGVRL